MNLLWLSLHEHNRSFSDLLFYLFLTLLCTYFAPSYLLVEWINRIIILRLQRKQLWTLQNQEIRKSSDCWSEILCILVERSACRFYFIPFPWNLLLFFIYCWTHYFFVTSLIATSPPPPPSPLHTHTHTHTHTHALCHDDAVEIQQHGTRSTKNLSPSLSSVGGY